MKVHEFQKRYNLSDKQFRTVRVEVAKRTNTDSRKLTEKRGATDWHLVHEAIWRQVAGELYGNTQTVIDPDVSNDTSTNRFANLRKLSTAIVNAQPPTIDVTYDEPTGAYLTKQVQTVSDEIESSRQTVNDIHEMVKIVRETRHAIEAQTKQARRQKIEDELAEYELELEYKTLRKAQMQSKNEGVTFEGKKRLDELERRLSL